MILISATFLVIGVVVVLWRLGNDDKDGTAHGWAFIVIGLGLLGLMWLHDIGVLASFLSERSEAGQ